MRRLEEERDIGDRHRRGGCRCEQRRQGLLQAIEQRRAERSGHGDMKPEAIEQIGISPTRQVRLFDCIEAGGTPSR